jgi:hypothetical protein
MTEYTVKEIGHQWIVYADRRSIATCADETSALKLMAGDSAANGARSRRWSIVSVGPVAPLQPDRLYPSE